MPHYFPYFTTQLDALSEVDESGKCRDFALGGTPSIGGWTMTPKNVLFRVFKEGKAKLVNTTPPTDYQVLNKKYKQVKKF